MFAIPVPGGGHLYAGETGKGLAMLGAGTAVPVLGAVITRTTDVEDDVIRTAASLAGLGAWIYPLVDAAPAARCANERNGYAVTVHPSVVGEHPALAVRVVW